LIFNAFLNFYFFLMLLRLFLGWILPIYSNHPALQLLFLLTEPLLRPIRQHVATIKRFDWTPIAAMIGLKIISLLVIYALMLLGAPPLIL
jgi:YggT family protein